MLHVQQVYEEIVRELARAIVAGELDLLARRDVAKLANRFNAPEEEVIAAITLVRTLDPRPGSRFDPGKTEYVTPDAYAMKVGGRWRVSLSPDCQPRLAINQHYCGLIARAQRSDDRCHLHHFRSCSAHREQR